MKQAQTRFDRISARSFNVLILLYLIYSVINYQTNAWATGVSDADRTNVYIIIGALVAIQGWYLVSTRPAPKYLGMSAVLALLAAWTGFVNVVIVGNTWLGIVHLGLLLWWLVTFSYFNRMAYYSGLLSKRIPLVMGLFFFGYLAATLYSQTQLSTNLNREFVAANVIYYALAAFPFILLWKRGWVITLSTVILVAVTLISLKRGAIITVIVMLLVYFLVDAYVGSNRARLIPKLLALAGVSAIALFTINSQTEGFLLERFETDALLEGSGRSDINALLWEQFLSGTPQQILFGRGANLSVETVGTGAHNDLLGAVVSYGLVGVGLTLALFLVLLRMTYEMTSARSSFAPSLAAATSIAIVSSLVSGLLFVQSSFFLFALFGYAQGSRARERRLKAVANKSKSEQQSGATIATKPIVQPRPRV